MSSSLSRRPSAPENTFCPFPAALCVRRGTIHRFINVCIFPPPPPFSACPFSSGSWHLDGGGVRLSLALCVSYAGLRFVGGDRREGKRSVTGREPRFFLYFLVLERPILHILGQRFFIADTARVLCFSRYIKCRTFCREVLFFRYVQATFGFYLSFPLGRAGHNESVHSTGSIIATWALVLLLSSRSCTFS